MAAADYRLLTEATGQRIAAALEALSGTGAAAAAARTNLDVYSKGETDNAIEQSTADLNNKIIRLQDKFDAINVDGTSDGDGNITIDLDSTTYALIGCTPDRTGITGGYTGVFFVLPYGATTSGKYLAKILKDDMTILRNQKVLFKVNYIRRAD